MSQLFTSLTDEFGLITGDFENYADIPATVTTTGNEITDARRTEGTGTTVIGHSYDGRLGDSSFGVWEATTNLVINGGFETNTTGWAAVGGGASITRATGTAKFGSASLQVTPGGAGTGAQLNSITTTPGATYVLSCWINAPNGLTVTLTATDLVYNSTPLSTTTLSGNGGWQRASLIFIALGSSTFFRFIGSATTAFNIDGVQLEQRRAATTLTVSGNEITDALRLEGAGTNVVGHSYDGRTAPDSSFGIWESATNLIKNGGFETNVANWTKWSGGTVTITQDTTTHQFGTASMKVVTDGTSGNQGVAYTGGTGAGGQITISGGATYAFSLWAKGNAGGELLSLQIGWYDANAVPMTGTTANITLTTSWTRYVLIGVAPGNATQCYAHTANQGTSAYTYWIDGVQFEQRRAAATFTTSGNEVTDITRQQVLTTASSGQMMDGQGISTPNWVTNPNFKNNITNWNAFGGTSTTGGVSSWNPTGGISGGCAQFSCTGGATPSTSYIVFESLTSRTLLNCQSQAMPVTTGQTVRARATAQLSALSAGPVDITLMITWYDNTGTALGSSVAQSQTSAVVGTWYNLSGTATAIAGAVYAAVRVQCGSTQAIPNGATITALLDNAQICDNGADPGTYVDGDSVGYSWWGTSELSATKKITADSSFGIRRPATNLFRHGQIDSVAADFNLTSSGVVSINTDTTNPPPFSTQSASLTVDGTFTNQGVYCSSATGLALTAGTTVAGSIYMKGASGQTYVVTMNVVNTDASTSFGNDTVVTATGAWQLITPATTTVGTGKTGDRVRIRVLTNTARAETFWVAHAMLETGQPTVAPYVPTTGGVTATHNGGRVQAPSTQLGTATQGWFAARVRMGYNAANVPNGWTQLLRWGSGASDYIELFYDGSEFAFGRAKTGSGSFYVNAPYTSTAGTYATVVAMWNSTTVQISVNGAAFLSAACTAIPTIADITYDIGSSNATHMFDGDFLWTASGTGTLTNADATTLNALGNTDPSVDSVLGSTAALAAVWTADSSAYLTPGATLQIATPYVETNGATATRNASLVQTTTPGILPSSSAQVWFAARVELNTDDKHDQFIAYLTCTSGQSIYLYRTQGGPTNRIWAMQQSSVGNQGWVDNTNPSGNLHTIIGYVTPTTFGISVDGGAFLTSTRSAGANLTPTALYLGSDSTGANQINGRILWFMTGTGTLANADATTLNALGNTDPNVDTTLGSTAGVTSVWTADTSAYLTPRAALQIATPYIHTDGTSQTRPSAGITAPASLIGNNVSQFWCAYRVRLNAPYNSDPTFRDYFRWTSSAGDTLCLQYRADSQYFQVSRRTANSGGITADSNSATQSFVSGTMATVIGVWTPTQIGISINGGPFQYTASPPGTGANFPSTFWIGWNSNNSRWCDDDIKWSMFGTGTLTNTDAANLYALGDNDPTDSVVGAAAKLTAIMPFNTAAYSQSLPFPSKHLNIRSYHSDTISVPRTMIDFKQNSVNSYQGTTMGVLNIPRTVQGSQYSARTLGALETYNMLNLDAFTIFNMDYIPASTGNENWSGTGITYGPDSTLNYAPSLSVPLTTSTTTVTSSYADNLSTGFGDASDYVIEMALPNLAAQGASTAGTLTTSGNEITDAERAESTNTIGHSYDGLGYAWVLNLPYKNYAGDPLASASLIDGGHGAPTRSSLGGGVYQFTIPPNGVVRMLSNLGDLVNGTTYTSSVNYSNASDPTIIESDWCDVTTGVNGVNYVSGLSQSSGRIVISASKATYDNTYRFFDISNLSNTNTLTINLNSAQTEIGPIAHSYSASTTAQYVGTGDSSFGIWEAATNLCKNGGFETNTTNWQVSGSNTLAVDSTHSKFGTKSGLITYNNGPSGDTDVGYYSGTLTVGATYAASCWVYLPTGYSGSGFYISPESSGIIFHKKIVSEANPALVEQWQQLTTIFTVIGLANGASTGTVSMVHRCTNSTGGAIPNNGQQIWIDGCQLEQRLSANNITGSGNEVTDATRFGAASWTTTQAGSQVDELGWNVVNWATNPSFKTNLNNTTIFAGAGVTGASSTWNASGGIGGTGCAQEVGTGGAANSYASAISIPGGSLVQLEQYAMPCTSGQVIRVRGSANVSALSAGTTPDITLTVQFYDNTGTNFSTLTAATQTLPVVGTWYSLSGTVTAPANAAYATCRINVGVSGNPIPNGSTFTILFDNMQLCDNAIDPGSYVDGDTNTSFYSWWGASGQSVTRKFTGSSTYYIDRSATNLFKYGQCDSVGVGSDIWISGGSGGVITITTDATVPAPFSPQSIKAVVDGTNNNQGLYASVSGSWPQGTSLVGSVWFKGVSGKVYKTSINYYNGTTEKGGSSTNFTATGAWQLITPTPTTVQTGDTASAIRMYIQTTTAVADTFWTAHAMVEAGLKTCAKYVATHGGATATNPAGAVTIPANTATQSFGTMTTGGFAIRLAPNWSSGSEDSTFPTIFRWMIDINNRIICYYNSGNIRLQRVGNGANSTISIPYTAVAGTPLTIIGKWDSGNLYLSINGAAFTTVANTFIPVGTQPTFVNIGSGDNAWDGEVYWVLGGIGGFSAADVTSLNSLGNSDPDVDNSITSGIARTVWTADNASYLYSGQNQNIATPYVHTDGASATRNASRVQLPGSAFSSQQGWIALRMRMPYSSSQIPRSTASPWQWLFNIQFQGSPRESIDAVMNANKTAGNVTNTTIDLETWVNGSSANGGTSQTVTFNAGDYVTYIAYWTPTTTGVSINGAAFTIGSRTTVTSLPMPATVDIGSQAGAAHGDVDIMWAMSGTGTLTNADANTLNTLGNTDPTMTTLGTAANTSIVAPMNTSSMSQGSYLDLTSTIDFSSDPGYNPSVTDSLPFNTSTNSITAGGNTYLQFPRSALTKSSISNIQAIRLNLKSVGTYTFKAAALRMYSPTIGYWDPTHDLEVDTKRGWVYKRVPQNAATTTASNPKDFPLGSTRPKNGTYVIKFGTGTQITTANVATLFARYPSYPIKAQVSYSSTGCSISVIDANTTLNTTSGAALINSTEYYLVLEAYENQVRASVWTGLGSIYSTQVLTTGWQTTAAAIGRGYIGFNLAAATYNTYMDYITAGDAEFARYYSKTLQRVHPVKGVTIGTQTSQAVDLTQGLLVANGDATLTTSTTRGFPTPPSSLITRTGAQWIGGLITADPIFIGNTKYLKVVGDIYPVPSSGSSLRGQYRILFINKYGACGYVSVIQNLLPNQWNHFEIPINAQMVPANYSIQLEQTGLYSDSFYLSNFSLQHLSVAWEVSPDGGTTYFPFLTAKDAQYTAANFSNNPGTSLVVKGIALSDTAWVSNYELIPIVGTGMGGTTNYGQGYFGQGTYV